MISSAPELFQRRMNKILEGLHGVICLMDNVLVFGASQAEHDTCSFSATGKGWCYTQYDEVRIQQAKR